jgi:hypothetical protein
MVFASPQDRDQDRTRSRPAATTAATATARQSISSIAHEHASMAEKTRTPSMPAWQ